MSHTFRQEPDSIAGFMIASVTVASVIVIVATIFGTELVTRSGRRSERSRAVDTSHAKFFDMNSGARESNRRRRRELERWGWVDRSRGVATIPIDRAVTILVDRGEVR